jgi:hypothetical protein
MDKHTYPCSFYQITRHRALARIIHKRSVGLRFARRKTDECAEKSVITRILGAEHPKANPPYSLAKLGFVNNPGLEEGAGYILSIMRENVSNLLKQLRDQRQQRREEQRDPNIRAEDHGVPPSRRRRSARWSLWLWIHRGGS